LVIDRAAATALGVSETADLADDIKSAKEACELLVDPDAIAACLAVVATTIPAKIAEIAQHVKDAFDQAEVNHTACINSVSVQHTQCGENALVLYKQCNQNAHNNFLACLAPYMKIGEIDESIIGISNIYPNPSTGSFNVSYIASSNCFLIINVYDLSSRLVSNQENQVEEGINSFQVDLNLGHGMYVLEIKENDSIYHMKFIIE
jgi:hypothetical protein